MWCGAVQHGLAISHSILTLAFLDGARRKRSLLSGELRSVRRLKLCGPVHWDVVGAAVKVRGDRRFITYWLPRWHTPTNMRPYKGRDVPM